MKRPESILPLAVGASAALFYLCFHSTFFNFDGVACAIAVELGDLRHLVHGNHLAYGLAGLAWTGLWRLLGYMGPALVPLQALDSLLGGLGAGLFCRMLLRRFRVGPPAALAASAALTLSFAWWFWSLEAQVYMLGAVFLILAADAAFAEEPSPWLAGLFHGLALLGHVGHAMFLFCAAFLLRRPGRTTSLWLRYAAALAVTVLAAYAAAALWCVQPRTAKDWRLWLLGSAALTVQRDFSWHGGYSWVNLRDWAVMTLRIFCDPAGLPQPWRALGWALSGAGLGAAVAGAARAPRAGGACLLWLAGYCLLFVSWEPTTIVYRITDLLPFWLLAALFAQAAPWRSWALAGWVLAAGLFNGVFLILPQTDPAHNAEYQEALWLARNTPPQAWVVAAARGQVYVPYFAGRKPLNLRYYEGRPGALAQRLGEMERLGLPVFVTGATLRDGGWMKFFRGCGLREVASGSGGALYRVGRKGNPSGSNQKKFNTAPAARKGPKGTGSDMRSSPRTTRPTP